MNAGSSFTIEMEMDAPLESVHAFLLDLDNLAPLHPLIESIELLDSVSERPAARRYRVVDRIPLGPFKLKTVYVAELESLSEAEVCGRAWQSPGVTLETRYRLKPRVDGGGTHLEEQVLIDAPFGLRRFVAAQARRAHEETLAKMKCLLETRSRSLSAPHPAQSSEATKLNSLQGHP